MLIRQRGESDEEAWPPRWPALDLPGSHASQHSSRRRERVKAPEGVGAGVKRSCKPAYPDRQSGFERIVSLVSETKASHGGWWEKTV
ncbi:hypothetical protein LZ30DRAFT_719917 [Colletotrichum cereale]|nr:hypothetical protein LZ30DRAFT_719917 [Colletotrichum cereale]